MAHRTALPQPVAPPAEDLDRGCSNASRAELGRALAAPGHEDVIAFLDHRLRERGPIRVERVEVEREDACWRQRPGDALERRFKVLAAEQVVDGVVEAEHQIEFPELG